MCTCKREHWQQCSCGQKTPLKLEAGKTYVDRNGRKTRIISTDRIDPNGFTCVGLTTVGKNPYETCYVYMSYGRFIRDQDNSADLVAEYKEPVFHYMNIYDRLAYTIGSYESEEVCRGVARDVTSGTATLKVVARIRVNINTGKVEQLSL